MNRRAFLSSAGALGFGAVVASVAPLRRLATRYSETPRIVRREHLMGTFVSVTVRDPSRDRAEEAMGLAFEEMIRTARLLTRFRPDSALSVLNRDGVLPDSPPELALVVRRSNHFHRLTDGAFDITVEPLIRLFHSHIQAEGTAPSLSQTRRAGALIHGDAVGIRDRAIRLAREDMGLTLDGIAKGYVTDRGIGALKARGIGEALINAGGDIRAMGGAHLPWRIAIQDPANKNASVERLSLGDGAVATSGDYEVFYDAEKVHHHIIDPATGRSPNHASSVTVRTTAAMDADALSTAVFVKGPAEGLRFVEGLPGAECLILTPDGRRAASTGWRSA